MSLGAAVGGASLVSGLLAADASRDAARTQARSAERAAELARQTTLQGLAAQGYTTAPWRNIGAQSLYRLAGLLGLDPSAAMANMGGFTGGGSPGGSPTGGGAPWDTATMGGGDYRAKGIGPGFANAFRRAGLLNGGGGGAPQQTPLQSVVGSIIPELPMPTAAANAPFTADPGYEFRLNEGLRGLENSGAARGMQLSGAGIKGITRFGQDYASNEFQNQINRLMQLSGFGGSTANQTGGNAASLLSGLGGTLGNLATQSGNAMAAGQIGSANALSGGLGGLGNAFLLSQLFGGGGVGA